MNIKPDDSTIEMLAPGISINEIFLIKATVEVVNPQGAKEYGFGLSGIRRVYSENKSKMLFEAAFDTMKGVVDPVFKLQCNFMAVYKRHENASLSWEQFTDEIALSHLIPYVREFVSNITHRLPCPPLMLPPTNTKAMIDAYLQEQAKSDDNQARPSQELENSIPR